MPITTPTPMFTPPPTPTPSPSSCPSYMPCQVEYKPVKTTTEYTATGNTSSGPFGNDTCPPEDCKCNVSVEEKKKIEVECYEYSNVVNDGCSACGKSANDSILMGSTIPISGPKEVEYSLTNTSGSSCCKPLHGCSLTPIKIDQKNTPGSGGPKIVTVSLRCI